MEEGEDFGPWLARQLRRQGTSQTEFARRVEVTRAAVSAWVTGRAKPRVELFPRIADELGVDVGLLHRRETDAVSALPIQWHHPPAEGDEGREYGDSAAFTSAGGLTTLVRHAVQNSLDERLDGERPVRMRFTLQELTGERLRSFLTALKWEQIEPHFETAARSRSVQGRVLAEGLRRLRDGSPLVLLRVDDYNAAGLTGPEYENGRFAAFVRRRLDGRKRREHLGGVYGLGKAAFWAASRLGLVLVNSTLSAAHEGRVARRVVGRVELPWRITDGVAFAGPAWLGERDTEKGHEGAARSWWADEKTVADLHLTRQGDEPGTSILVVGAYDCADADAGLDAMHENVVSALADGFWAALTGSRTTRPFLEASVCSLRNGELVEQRVDPSARHPALVAALQAYLDGETVDEPTPDGRVVAAEVPLDVPSPALAGARSRLHKALLLVAPASDTEDHGRVVCMRGTRTTVTTRRPRDLGIGAEPFHAVLLAGLATGRGDEAAHAAEAFLRAAEPPAHDRWGPTGQLGADYPGGTRRLDDFTRAVDEALRRVLSRRRATRRESTGQELLQKLLRLDAPEPGGVRRAVGYPVIERITDRYEQSGAWSLDVALRVPPRESTWSVVPVARLDVRSGGRPTVPWTELSAGRNCDVVDGAVLIAPLSRSATFRVRTAGASGLTPGIPCPVSVDLQHVREVPA